MQNIAETLKNNNQEHLLKALNKLSGAAREKLEKQIEAIDWEELSRLIREYVMQKPVTTIPADLAPASYFPLVPDGAEQEELYKKAIEKGVELIRAGKTAALTVAGGQGTRLGFDGPKGPYPITPVLHKTLFQYFAESLARVSEKYGSRIHWFIMTSELNDKATRDFFRSHAFFGLPEDTVHFFTQGFMPAIDYSGKVLMSAGDSIALTPDGHGGTLLALRKWGCLDLMKKLGVEYISYFQVDNPLVPVSNPLMLGLHAMENSEMSSIMLSKTNAFEKLGNFCVTGGKLQIIEYSDMPKELAERTTNGKLDFIAGSPAIHVISRSFVERLTAGGKLELPWHRADKKVAYVNADGVEVKPEAPNAVKLESFIFDALPLASSTIILEADRKECFAPTKNATGVDSAESCREMLCARDARRMELAGIRIPRKADGSPDCIVELSPRRVFDDADAVEFFKSNPAQAPERNSSTAYG